MTQRKPPAIATWLLDKLGYTRHNAALTGDLLEEFHSGRSGLWYWRQTAIVLATGMRRNASGALITFAVLFPFRVLADYLIWRFPGRINLHVLNWFSTLLAVGGLLLLAKLKKPIEGRVAGSISWLFFVLLYSLTGQSSLASLAGAVWEDFRWGASILVALMLIQAPMKSAGSKK